MRDAPICVSDFGDEVYRCHESGEAVYPEDVIFLSAVMPGIRRQYAIKRSFESRYRQSVRWFHENDRNCNTCKHLTRVPHVKKNDGLLYGRCELVNVPAHPYRDRVVDGVMPFAPDDWQGMPCYEPRWAVA